MASRRDYEIVGALDLDPSKHGRDMAEVIGWPERLGVRVSNQLRRGLSKEAELVVHATGSYLTQVRPQLEQALRARKNVISTCEELAEPWARHAEAARELDGLARQNKVTLVGTGINPGYAMDTLPVALTAMCQDVRQIRVRRVVDASKRRMQLQRKIGTGLTAQAFNELVAKKEIRHVGLSESVSLLARGLGWTLEDIQEQIEPVIATRRVVTDYFTVDPTFVTGVQQWGRGIVAGEPRIVLELKMAVDVDDTFDEAWIDGTPSLHSTIRGIHGDVSTAAVVANTARRVIQARPGLLTMLDLPIVGAH
jgi:4-hydroxy-tetrahydrodipicolinate reductase